MPTESEVLRVLAERLKALRAERGWTQEQLAARAHLGRVYIASIEIGQENPSLRTLIQLANALGVPVSDLLRQ